MATFVVENTTTSGIATTKNAVSSSDQFPNNGRIVIRVDNQDASPVNVTIVTPNNVDGDLSITDRIVSVTNGTDMIIGPFPKGTYNDGNGDVVLQFASTTAITCEVFTF